MPSSVSRSCYFIGSKLVLDPEQGFVSPADSVIPPRTVACQASLSMGFSRQECWSGLSCPPLLDPPDPETKPGHSVSAASRAASLPLESSGKPVDATCQDLIPPVHLGVRKWEFYQLFITNQIEPSLGSEAHLAHSKC